MSLTLIILFCADGFLLACLLIYLLVKYCLNVNNGNSRPIIVTDDEIKKEQPQTPPVIDIKPFEKPAEDKPVDIKSTKTIETVAPVAQAAQVISDTDADTEEAFNGGKAIKTTPFAKKISGADVRVKKYYKGINEYFQTYKKIHSRVSVKCDSYRCGRELVAKISYRGKTMKLHLALDVNKFEENVFHQKSLADIKAYEQTPFTVKVKSDRGYSNALKLIDELMTAKGVQKKL